MFAVYIKVNVLLYVEHYVLRDLSGLVGYILYMLPLYLVKKKKKKKATYTERGVRAFPQPSTGLRVEKKISQDLHTM